jgi:hypothetical protein
LSGVTAEASLPETYVVPPRRALVALSFLGALGFVAIGVALIVSDRTADPRIYAAGGLAILFFGWITVVVVQRMRRGAPLTLDAQGIHYAFAPVFDKPRLIPWSDIEGFAITRIQRQKLNAVRLRRYGNLLSQFPDDDAARVVKMFRRLMMMGQAAVVLGDANMGSGRAADLETMMRGGGAVSTLAEMFAHCRQHFGGEICLGWPDRDRGAEAFQAFLERWHARYGGENAGSSTLAPGIERA